MKIIYYLFALIIFVSLVQSVVAQSPELRVPATHEAKEMVFSKDDKMMISLGESELRIWRTEGPYLLKTLPMPGSDTLYDTDLHILKDNSKLVINQNGRVRLLNLQTFEWEKSTWKIENPSTTGLSNDGKFLYYNTGTGNAGKILKLDLSTGKSILVISFKSEEDASFGGKMSFNADESLLLGSSLIDYGGVLIDLKAKKILYNFKQPQWPLFINEAGNVIVSSQVKVGDSDKDTYGTNRKYKVEEMDPRTQKVLRSMTVATKSDDIQEYNGIIWIGNNGRDKILYEINQRFYTVNTTDFTQSKRQQVKFTTESFSSNSASLSAGGKFAFWSGYMTAFKTDDIKKPIQFGISPYQPFMLSDASQGNDLKLLAGNRLVNFDNRGLSLTQLPTGLFFDFHSSYRYLPSQKRLFIEGVAFKTFNDTPPYVYDLKDDTSNYKPLILSKELNYDVLAMREYDSLNTIILLSSDRFFIMDTRTLKVKQQVLYGDGYSLSVNVGQSNDDHICVLSPDKTKVIISLAKTESQDDNTIIVCYDLINKRKVWSYEPKMMCSNPVYFEGGKKIRFFTEKKALVVLDAQSGKMISSTTLIPQADNVSQFSPTQKYVLTKSFKEALFFGGISNFDVYDAVTKKLVLSVPQQRIYFKGAVFMANDKYLLTQDEDMKLWDLTTGKMVARIVLFQNSNDWILLTPDGRFDGSQGGLKQLYYVKGQDVIPLEQLYEGFYTPGLTKQVLAGTVSEGKQDIKNIKSPPSVQLTYEPSKTYKELLLEGQIMEVKVDKKMVQVVAEATCNEGVIEEIRLYHNGKLVGNSTRNLVVEDEKSKSEKKVFDIELLEGENSLKVVAINSQRTESKADEIVFIYKPKTPSSMGSVNEITLHMIVIGINKYKNPKYNLNYALADATSFKEAIEKGGSSIFTKTNIVFLNDEKATKEGISNELDKIKAAATPKDVFIFYYAGHGVLNEKKEFFLVPHDVTQLYGQDEALAQKGLSANQLQQFSKDIKAQKQLFMLDACQSAGALDQIVAARGAAEEKAIAQLARATGTHWLTASGSEQFASEFSQLGHGTFTYVLLEALSGKADKGGDKKITVKELDAYLQEQVPEVTAKYKGSPQYPASYGYGNDFPIGVVKN